MKCNHSPNKHSLNSKDLRELMAICANKVIDPDHALASLVRLSDEELSTLSASKSSQFAAVIETEQRYLESVIKPGIFDSPVDPMQSAELASVNDRIERCRMALARIRLFCG